MTSAEAFTEGDPLTAVVQGHKKPYRFHGIARICGHQFAERMASAWRLYPATEATARWQFENFGVWLKWLVMYSGHPDARPEILAAIQVVIDLFAGNLADLSVEDVRQACQAYGNVLAGMPGRIQTRRGRLSAVRGVLRNIGSSIGLPDPGRGISVSVYVRRGDEPEHPSLAEITRTGPVNWNNPDAALCSLLADAGLDQAHLTFDAKLAAVARLNSVRLSALRSILEIELRERWERFNEGTHLLTMPGLPSTENIVENLEPLRPIGAIRQWVAQVAWGNPEQEFALCLRWLLAGAKKGILTQRSRHPAYGILIQQNQAVREHYKLNSNSMLLQEVQEFVAIGPMAWTAAFGILMIDTGWNVQPLIDLPADPFIGQLRDGRRGLVTAKVLAQYKNRAGHDVDAVVSAAGADAIALAQEPAVGIFFSAVKVIEIVQQMTRRLRGGDPGEPLFLCSAHNYRAPVVPGRDGQKRWWTSLLVRHADNPVIGGLPITRPMIRKTILDIAAMEAAVDHAPAQLLANHAGGAVGMQRYLRSPWFQRELDNHIRRFQGLFEAAVSHDIADVAAHLGITEEELASRRDTALETGLGFACLQSLTELPPSVSGQRCDRLDRCHLGCSVRRFVPTERGLVSLVLTNRSLRAAEQEWIAQNPGRWADVWMPLLAETEAYLLRLRESTHRTRLAAAEHAVEVGLDVGDLTLISPW